ncbi:phage tail protein [Thioalkalivibrio sp. ALJ8]|uniref:phage tail protein n=1 Tax=Thioalkalivibrio sp. ALJ8 TaxID=1158757 RepID=UPI00036F5BCF|nr:phage tail protein [Thioalkalivibrio sp. ALJ8]
MSYTIDTSNIGAARRFLRGVQRAAQNASYRAVNRTAQQTRTQASRRIRQEVRLPARYVNDNLKVVKRARRDDPTAIIRGRRRPTRLARFGAKPITKRAAGARGDALRGIGAGRKAAGVSVNVGRTSGRSKMPGAFLIPLSSVRTNVFGGQQRDRTGHMGVFVRTGSGRGAIRHLYGPSVDQLFNRLRRDLQAETTGLLSREYERQLGVLMRREAGKL